jgi:hypothetical protein
MQICEPKTNMQERHWTELNEYAVEKFDAKSENFKMEQLIKADFIKKRDDVEEIISAAVNQNKIWEIIVKTETKWNTIMFDFTSWKGKASIFSAGRLNEILEVLMDDQNTIAAIQNKKHVKPFIESVVNLMQLFD